jgi:hypothetical protein
MIFDWQQHQVEPIPELNSVKRVGAHVEEYAKETRRWNDLEHRRYQDGQPNQEIDEKCGDTLI